MEIGTGTRYKPNTIIEWEKDSLRVIRILNTYEIDLIANWTSPYKRSLLSLSINKIYDAHCAD